MEVVSHNETLYQTTTLACIFDGVWFHHATSEEVHTITIGRPDYIAALRKNVSSSSWEYVRQ